MYSYDITNVVLFDDFLRLMGKFYELYEIDEWVLTRMNRSS